MTTRASSPAAEAYAGVRAGAGAGAAVLLYHAVGPHGGRFGIDPEAFADHLDAVVDSGRRPVTMSELADAPADTAELLVAISFDDGFADNLEVALPLLESRGIPATVYVTTSYVDGRSSNPAGMLSPLGVCELHAAGVEVGSHSVHHLSLDRLPVDRLREEMRSSKAWLEDLIGAEVRSFAYPHGHHNGHCRREVVAAGYRSAAIVMNAVTRPGADRFTMARLTIERHHATDDVVAMMNQQLPGIGVKLRARAGSIRRAARSHLPADPTPRFDVAPRRARSVAQRSAVLTRDRVGPLSRS